MKDKNKDIEISIVSPVYLAEDIVDTLIEQIKNEVQKITDRFEIILVEDGSSDGSWKKIHENCQKDKRITGIKLSRNFGQHQAILAGLNASKGEWIVVMDCDLQDRPQEIPNLYHKVLEGYDLVFAQRVKRRDNFLSKILSWYFYRILEYLTDNKYDNTIANFGVYHRKVIDAIKSFGDIHHFFALMANWVGFRATKIPVVHGKRYMGKSSYNFRKKYKLALWIILLFSEKPLRIAINIGFLITLIAIIYAVYIIYRVIVHDIGVVGWSSLIVSIWFLSGIIISIIGIVGLYIGRIFEQVKQRPRYIIDCSINS